jgi:glycolate oxidase FAD binding subunit
MTVLAPHAVTEMTDAVRATPHLIPIGASTKPALSAVGAEYVLLSCQSLCGVLEYEPDEFTITARAGTRLAELAAVLRERGQYLPFDPLFLRRGATLGGTVAAGLSGPGRFRFGGLRDFILGIRFVDGAGRLLRMGGKVLKNAAGFDLPKFFVGSLGRFGILAEVTLKVFPCPAATCTVRLDADTLDAAAAILTEAARGRWEIDALDVPPLSRMSTPGCAARRRRSRGSRTIS